MGALQASAEAIITQLGIAAIGYLVIRFRIIPSEALKYLSALAIEAAVPLYVFTNLMTNFYPESSSGWWQLPLWWILFAAVTLGMSLAAGMLFPASTRKEARTALYLYNPIFVPLAVIIGVYGTDSPYVADLFLFTMLTATFYFNVYQLFFRDKELLSGKYPIDRRKLFNPLIKATLLALLLKLSGASVNIPAVALDITGYVGSLAFPLITLIIGGYIRIDIQKAGKIRFPDILKFVLIKNLLFPAAAFGVLYLTRPRYNVAMLLLLAAAAPPLSTVPVLVERQKGNTEITNQFLVGSFLTSIVTMPLVIAGLNLLY